jgi:hypothetical protein
MLALAFGLLVLYAQMPAARQEDFWTFRWIDRSIELGRPCEELSLPCWMRDRI